MILIGFILILLAAALGVALVLATISETDSLPLESGPFSVEVAPLWLVIGGALTMLLLWWGWAAIRGSARRKARARKENKELERQAAADRAERERLEREQQSYNRELVNDRERMNDRPQVGHRDDRSGASALDDRG